MTEVLGEFLSANFGKIIKQVKANISKNYLNEATEIIDVFQSYSA